MTVGKIRTAILFAWASFFGWLLATGDVYRYIGPRTYWVVVFGAVALSAVAIGNLILVMKAEAQRPARRHLLGFSAALIPLVLVLLIPRPSLGSLAASRKLSGGVVSSAVRPPVPEAGGEIGFREIGYATESLEYANEAGLSDGYPVELTGFVSGVEAGIPEGAFPLTRFSIFCCAADVVPYTVPVRAPGSGTTYARDAWVEVQGALYLEGETWVLEAERIQEVPEPPNPYI